jgi:hypothetical protein
MVGILGVIMCIRPLALCVAILLASALVAQTPNTPQAKIQRGFASLSQGSWAHALAEWNHDGTLGDEKLEESRTALERMVSNPRTIGEWGVVHPPVLQRLWQRHWAMATFDRGALFLVVDFHLHKGEWRLFRITPTQDPREILPNLDAPVSIRERN